jgi:hypothetical protein
MAECAPSAEVIMGEVNHQHYTGRPLTVASAERRQAFSQQKEQIDPPLQVNHRSGGVVVDSGPAIPYNVSAWELL